MKQNVLNTDLTGKVAVVTGAGGVLCSALSRALAAAGAKVALISLHLESSQKVEQTILADGGVAKAYGCDVLAKAALAAVAEDVKNTFGPCDILLNGAGGNDPAATTEKEYFSLDDLQEDTKTFFRLDTESIRSVFDLNCLGTLIPTQVFAEQMVGRTGCSVLNITSMNAIRPLTKIPAYSGAKAAVSNLTQWMAVHFSRVGIRVNAIAPGFFATRQNQKLLFNDDGTPTARSGKILAATPMGRFGVPEELEGAVLFLLNEKAAGFITGTVLPIDGGFHAYSGV